MPQRIQRRRERGWRMPEGAVYVGRGSRFGNPARVGRWASVGPQWREGGRCTMSTFIRDRAGAVTYFRSGMRHGGMVVADHLGIRLPTSLPSVEDVRRKLAGKDLVCWCPLDQPCHADVLLEIANSVSDEDRAGIAEDVHFERTQDAASRYQDTEVDA